MKLNNLLSYSQTDSVLLPVDSFGSENTVKGNVQLSLCLTKYNVIKTYPLLNYVDVFGEWKYGATHS
jgi:hypothetical protein